MKKPAKKIIPVTRPTLEAYSAYAPLFKESIESGMLTNGKNVKAFEERAAKYLGVKHCIAVSSCSSGLMLVLKGLGLTGEVIIPSFTFAASGQPLLWNNLKPVFADIDPKTYTIDPKSVEKLITKKTSAILATHVFGAVCEVEKLQALARKHKLKLIFDAAHAFGSTYKGKKAGNFGDAEVFSLSPIKVLTAAEGGLVATNDDELANFVKLGRNYGDDGANNMLFAGLSARMSEFHAAIALRSIAKLPDNLKKRRSHAQYLIKAFQKIEPKIKFQTIPSDTTTTYYILSAYIDSDLLGYTRDDLFEFFKENGIITRKYFYPPLHKQPVFKKFAPSDNKLPVTMKVTHTVLALPMYSHISKEDMDQVIKVFKEFTTKIKNAA